MSEWGGGASKYIFYIVTHSLISQFLHDTHRKTFARRSTKNRHPLASWQLLMRGSKAVAIAAPSPSPSLPRNFPRAVRCVTVSTAGPRAEDCKLILHATQTLSFFFPPPISNSRKNGHHSLHLLPGFVYCSAGLSADAIPRFSVNLGIPTSAIEIETGKPKIWVDIADSGNHVHRNFCGDCGTYVVYFLVLLFLSLLSIFPKPYVWTDH